MNKRNRLEDAFWDWPGEAPRWFLEKWLYERDMTIMASGAEFLVEAEVAWRMLWRTRRLSHENGFDSLLEGDEEAPVQGRAGE